METSFSRIVLPITFKILLIVASLMLESITSMLLISNTLFAINLSFVIENRSSSLLL